MSQHQTPSPQGSHPAASQPQDLGAALERGLTATQVTIGTAEHVLSNYYSKPEHQQTKEYGLIKDTLQDLENQIHAARVSQTQVPILSISGFSPNDPTFPVVSLVVIPKENLEKPFQLICETRVQTIRETDSQTGEFESKKQDIFTDGIYLNGEEYRLSSSAPAGKLSTWRTSDLSRPGSLIVKTRSADAVEKSNFQSELSRLASLNPIIGWEAIEQLLDSLPVPNNQVSTSKLKALAENVLTK